jgi:hypothetical protein
MVFLSKGFPGKLDGCWSNHGILGFRSTKRSGFLSV